MMSLIEFPLGRTTTPSQVAECACGSVWFQPVRHEVAGGPVPGAVQMTPDGLRIIAFAGEMQCAECGKHY
ncbi:hypothetical protein D1781_03790 [Amnibacterium setariae]|uniref:Uncharacterized protein n=1 Tax=Amnibacterium setariae TaxID=2306585 RepID=A0A3A1U2L3_9MICO|nr:hypothetical protein D1781_03790 [Amnibacterium setariae]